MAQLVALNAVGFIYLIPTPEKSGCGKLRAANSSEDLQKKRVRAIIVRAMAELDFPPAVIYTFQSRHPLVAKAIFFVSPY